MYQKKPWNIEKIDWIRVPITPQMMRKAEKMALARNVKFASTFHTSDTAELTGALCELGVRKFLWEYDRVYEAPEFEGVSDGGVDIIVKAGTINVKGNFGEPSPYRKLYARTLQKHDVDFFCQCFWDGDEIVVAGLVDAETFLVDEHKDIAKDKDGRVLYESWMMQNRWLTFKPSSLVEDYFTDSKHPITWEEKQRRLAEQVKKMQEQQAVEKPRVTKFDLLLAGKYKLGSK